MEHIKNGNISTNFQPEDLKEIFQSPHNQELWNSGSKTLMASSNNNMEHSPENEI